jgi:hypothetical protein
MLQDCSASLSGTCCQLNPVQNAPVVATNYTPERSQQAGISPIGTCLALLSDSQAGQQSLYAVSPPDPSPGGHSVLRI